MNDIFAGTLPQNLHLLQLPGFSSPDDPARPNRVCICISDLHFTDGTVGSQSADAVVWEDVFESIMDICVNEEAEELHLILAGDVVDLIRSSRWVDASLFPWDRESEAYLTDAAFKEKYDGVLMQIMSGIVARHAQPPRQNERAGFFHMLKQLPQALADYDYRNSYTGACKNSRVKRINTVALLGNHDKEVLVSAAVLKKFYEDCLGQAPDAGAPNGLSDAYRRWIGRMYFNDEKRFLEHAPWTPFYWGDRGFRLFVTHGHWRDDQNNRGSSDATPDSRWTVDEGWNLKRWQNMAFSPFTRPCWGDTVAAALLSGFMIRSKRALDTEKQQLVHEGKWTPQIEALFNTIKGVLDEMDLYRPNASAVRRLQILTRELRRTSGVANAVRGKIEAELFSSLHAWLNMPFTLASAPESVRWMVRAGKWAVNGLRWLYAWSPTERIALWFAYLVVRAFESAEQSQRNDPTLQKMHTLTAFLEEYRRYGFRIHSEGHTHIPLQENLYFKRPETPASRQNYTYVNSGTWRNQVRPTQRGKYRRLSVGRALVIVDKYKAGSAERDFGYYAEDLTGWSDQHDAWSRGAGSAPQGV